MLNDLINKYKATLVHMIHVFEEVQTTGVIPNPDVEGAPQTVDEALYALSGLIAVLEQVIQDLTLYQMEQHLADERDFVNLTEDDDK